MSAHEFFYSLAQNECIKGERGSLLSRLLGAAKLLQAHESDVDKMRGSSLKALARRLNTEALRRGGKALVAWRQKFARLDEAATWEPLGLIRDEAIVHSTPKPVERRGGARALKKKQRR